MRHLRSSSLIVATVPYDRGVRFVWLALVLAACGRIGFEPFSRSMLQGLSCGGSGSPYQEGQTYAAGDGCNSCTCMGGVLSCTTNTCSDAGTIADAVTTGDGSVAADPCAPSGGCPNGPACGTVGVCCGMGEQCVGAVCMCGASPSCTGLDHCLGGIGTNNSCATVCCHGVNCPP
jgi:hypothetical protein